MRIDRALSEETARQMADQLVERFGSVDAAKEAMYEFGPAVKAMFCARFGDVYDEAVDGTFTSLAYYGEK
jgi:hypothetical protein